ncbi:UNVERIFIED_CONTAM: HNH endonuclease [Kocuria sp. CPCC 205316]|uniref:hypothetical protein n=1 Tax=Kocuria TaxID=57493 RepID=UPI0036DEB58A
MTDAGCWEVNTYGNRYLSFTYGGEQWQAHRWAWVYLAELPLRRFPEEQLDHICENTACIRPAHLQKVTQAQNNWLTGERKRLREAAGPEAAEVGLTKPLSLAELAATVRISPELIGMPPNPGIIQR